MIVVIKSGGYNLTSIEMALKRLGATVCVTQDPNDIYRASHVILPGVGHAANAMSVLRSSGLDRVIQQLTQPVLGICLGMQLLYETSAEGEVDTLNIIPGHVRALTSQPGYCLPHMGWNQLNRLTANGNPASPLLKEIPDGAYSYFVHRYAAPINQTTLMTTTHGEAGSGEIFSSVVQQRNFFGIQAHPERSSLVGQRFLLNFLQC